MPIGYKPLPDYRDTYFPRIIGPFMTYKPSYVTRMQVNCHICIHWCEIVDTLDEAIQIIQRHIWDQHDPHPKPNSRDYLPSPG